MKEKLIRIALVPVFIIGIIIWFILLPFAMWVGGELNKET